MILGRTGELARIESLLADVRTGSGGSLVLRGEAGIGKTALLDLAAAAGEDMQVLRGVGIESEIEVPFAGLHLLLYPYLDRLDSLPRPQAGALRTAFGLSEADPAERFLIGAATLSLLSELADERPLLCLIDDAQWFDQASTDALLFTARRLRLEPVAIVFAVRDGVVPAAGQFPTSGPDVMSLSALDRDSSTALLHGRAHALAGPTRARILAEARGNPLAIIEFATALTALGGRGDRAWSLPVEPLPVAGQVQEAFRAQIGDLPDATQRLLLLAAADETASFTVVLRAAERLGLAAADLEPAERASLIELTADTIAFRHPLIRAAAYQGAPRAWRAPVHRALADTLTGDLYADRRAWHLAAATPVPDEAVADELERAARRAAQRGGSGAVATALVRAAELSVDDARRATRLVAAARAAYDAGWLDRAGELSAAGARVTTDESTLADAVWIQAQVAYERSSPAAAAELALASAEPIVHLHPDQAVSILTDAVGCAKDACAHDLLRRSAKQLALLSLRPDSPQRPVVEGLIGLGDHLDGAEQAIGAMRKLVVAARDRHVEGLVERILAGYLALIVADDEAATELLEDLVSDARRLGALGWLPYAQEPLSIALLLRGRFRDAETTVAEALSVSADLGQQTQVTIMSAIPAWLAAVAGDATRCESLAETMLRDQSRHPTNAALATWALGTVDLARGRFDAAATRLETVCAGPARHDFLIRAIPDQVEAAVRSGQAALAARHLPAFDLWAERTERDHALALSRRCRALLTTDGDAEAHYDSALRLHLRSERPYDHARTSLLYGEWLRRRRRRTEANERLTDAMDGFEQVGAGAWLERTSAELTALGDRPVARPRDRDPLARLTAQERQVVRLAASGLSNRDIAAQLFLSPRTVEHHLYRAYPKLGITKRTELGGVDVRPG